MVIADKPELATAIAAALGFGRRQNGYVACGYHLVTWAFGHMLELTPPEPARWTLDALPLPLAPYPLRPIAAKRLQLKIIKSLLATAECVIHAGDPDEEGQLIIDEILEWAEWRGPVQRALIHDYTPSVVNRALADARDNAEYLGLSCAARYRLIGDWIYGLNLTRAYTLAARQAGYDQVLSVGRVQTPILGLVVRRDRAHQTHAAQRYCLVTGTFTFAGLTFQAERRSKGSDPVDHLGRLTEPDVGEAAARAASGKTARVASSEMQVRAEPPPLPFNLLKLQVEASRRWAMQPSTVKAVTQALREVHKLITFNRSDCQYLPDAQHADAPGVLAAIAETLPRGVDIVTAADPALKGRAFDSSEVGAHHAIIPTQTRATWKDLTADERRLYELIARTYVLQFLPARSCRETRLVLEAGGESFGAKVSVTLSPGWRGVKWANSLALIAGEDGDEAVYAGQDLTSDLSQLAVGFRGECRRVWVDTEVTKPPALYTMASLLIDLTRADRYVQDETLRATLVDRDRHEAGASGGLGTAATRDSMIATLIQRGFIEEMGKHIVSTSLGQVFHDRLPQQAVWPEMTALWHAQQKTILADPSRLDPLLASLEGYVAREVARARSSTVSRADAQRCSLCSAPLRRFKGTNGAFWRCSTFNVQDRSGCAFIADDIDGAPLPRLRAAVSQEFVCMTCGAGLSRRPSRTPGTGWWWGCSRFPSCTKTYSDLGGRPDYEKST